MQMDEELKVVIRNMDREQDQACIFSTWRNAAYYGALEKPNVEAKDYFREKTAEIREVLDTAMVRIACLQWAPEVILGYSVYRDTHLDFIYVKLEFRGKGIGSVLMPKNIQTITPNLTKIGKVIAKKKNLFIKANEATQGE